MSYVRCRASMRMGITHRRPATTVSSPNHVGETSTRTNPTHLPYPFPSHPRPSPHEIFHLPINASANDIKSRYYELVKHHHPDSPQARAHTPCPKERHARFQHILSAYHTLRYPSSFSPSSSGTFRSRGSSAHFGHGPGVDPFMAELDRRRQTSMKTEFMKQRKQAMENEEREKEEEEWRQTAGGPREKVMLAIATVLLLGGLYPSLFFPTLQMDNARPTTAVHNLTQARNDAQEVGHARREEVRRRVNNIKSKE